MTDAVVRERRILFEGMGNVRDLGGVGSMPRGLLYRTCDPNKSTDSDKRKFKEELQLHTVIDLRSAIEVEKGFEDLGVRRVHCNVIPDGKILNWLANTMGRGPPGHAEVNEMILDKGKVAIAQALRALSAPGALPALFHCTYGKDRTGLLAVLLLELLGVQDQEIVADYALTQEFVGVGDLAARAKHVTKLTGAELDEAMTRNVFESRPESAELTLAMLRRVYGSAEAYIVKALGFSADEVAQLRCALLAAPPSQIPPSAVDAETVEPSAKRARTE